MQREYSLNIFNRLCVLIKYSVTYRMIVQIGFTGKYGFIK